MESRGLNIIVVGAGIGGLSTAIALGREGHQVTIFERSRFAGEIGAAVSLAPNSNMQLRRWGIFTEAIGTECEYMSESDPQDNQRYVWETTLLRKEFSTPWNLVHRADLHDMLKKEALEPTGAPGSKPAKLQLTSTVTSCDPSSSSITLSDGTIHQADAVIIADGAQSKLRNVLLGHEYPAYPSGWSAYRFLLPAKAVADDPRTSRFLERSGHIHIWIADDRRVLTYSVRNKSLLNIVCIHPDRISEDETKESWSAKGSKESLLRIFKEFHPDIVAMLEKSDPDTIGLWKLLTRPMLPKWVEGSTCLMGDAAHPVLPHYAQGANQAIEDAAALSVFLRRGTKPDEVPDRLKLYEGSRKIRTSDIEKFSRELANARVDADRETVFNDEDAKRWRVNFAHDTYEESQRVLKQALDGNTK